MSSSLAHRNAERAREVAASLATSRETVADLIAREPSIPNPTAWDENYGNYAIWNLPDGRHVQVTGTANYRLELHVSGGPRGGRYGSVRYESTAWLARDLARIMRDWHAIYALGHEYRDDEQAREAARKSLARSVTTSELLGETADVTELTELLAAI